MPRPPLLENPTQVRTCKRHGEQPHRGQRHYRRKDGTWSYVFRCRVCENERVKAGAARRRRAAGVPVRNRKES